MLVLGFYSKDKKSSEVVSHSQSTASQQTVCKFHLDPQYNIFHWGSTMLGDSTLWTKMAESNHNTDIPSTPSDDAGCFPTSSSWEQDLTMQTSSSGNKTVFSESDASVVNDHGKDNKDRKSTGDKANISNPKLNRGCPPLTANHTSADCANFTWTLNTIYSTGGLPYWGIQHYEPKWPSLIITRTFHQPPPMMRDACEFHNSQ